MSYVVATHQAWGKRVFSTVAENSAWTLVETTEALYQQLARHLRYVFFLNWSARVSDDVLAQVECVNFHCTALPYGRGGGPIENLIIRGHNETVLTAHRMTDEIDAGPIYGQRGPVSLAGTKEDILARFVEPCVELIRWIVTTRPQPTPQAGDVVRFSRLSPVEYEAFWRNRR